MAVHRIQAGAESPSWACAANAFETGIAPLGGRIYEISDSDQKEMAEDVGNVDITGISHEEQFELIENAENLLDIYKIMPSGKINVIVVVPSNRSGASMTTAEIPVVGPQCTRGRSCRARTKGNGLEALVDEEMVVGDDETVIGDRRLAYLLPTSKGQKPGFNYQEPHDSTEMTGACDALAITPSKLSAQKVSDEGTSEAVKQTDSTEHPNNIPFRQTANDFNGRGYQTQILGAALIFHITVHSRAPFFLLVPNVEEVPTYPRAAVHTQLSINNDELKKKLALAKERLQKYFGFWRSVKDELT
ncbi:hypothetical protein H9Q74_005138 [Fusarium xylarioides]|nr:hypothetical protein H9Q71_004902 [Fusarium xylarioides]KAG5824773.1 hypothetical protein H9Q74_005138 [Fusarium xylarioides]